ncbi:hypothetical protein IMCC3317_25530 [Kordia antarctica]|uniref:Uncharacterized protein n=1 Tax=Kordia antarctica TaxID=1218801 RepID=A0A7L4ZKM0_9FLAO|nr:hypothetical protein [Kordia antarctica]QHI37175.1 hypothetical protein IMCC3317_25530 [Kordia antarctica]
MKKKNLKSLKISKVLISNFTENTSTIKGGASGVKHTCGNGHTCGPGGCEPPLSAVNDCDDI